MTCTLSMVERASALSAIVHEHASQYRHSRPLIEQPTAIFLKDQKHPFRLTYDIKDIMLLGALTHSSILLTGDTDKGKTTLAKLVMNGLFGEQEEGWHKINIDIEYSRDMSFQTDFRIILKGKKSSEGLYTINPKFLLPGLITDEINRSHAKIVNQLMHIFDRDINAPDGTRASIGFEYGGGKRYQFQVAAINEGDEYTGTFDIDKAMRRRTIIEIPLNTFSPTGADKHALRRMLSKEITLHNKTTHVNELIAAYNDLERIGIHQNADLFIAYLESFDYCENSLTKEKGSIPAKNGSLYHVCTKPVDGANTVCRFIRSFEHEMCPFMTGITPGIAKNLISVARGLALLRAVKVGELLHDWVNGAKVPGLRKPEHFESSLQIYAGSKMRGRDLAKEAYNKYVTELTVRPEDVEGVFGFVAYSKIGMSPAWIAKHYQGNRFAAVKSFVAQAKERFEDGVLHLLNVDVNGIVGSGLRENHNWTALEEYCIKENPWFLRSMEPYIDQKSATATKREMSYLFR